MKRSRGIKNTGFTLIEVLVAVAILAFMVPALMLLMMKQTDYAGILRDKTIANWVAENTLTELRLNRMLSGTALQRERSDNIPMAATDWRATITVEPSLNGALVMYTVSVEREPDKPLATLITYLQP